MLRKKPLPTSISATRQQLKNRLKTRWKGEWSTSTRFKRLLAIDHSLPSQDYLHIISQLRRNQASLLTQMRTGHAPLNEILYRIKKSDTPDCPHCGTGFRESIFHFLLSCPHYTSARRTLQSSLNRHALSIPFFLGTRSGIPHLLRFIANTNRLRTIFGDVRPDDDFVITEKNEQKDVPFQLV